MYKSLQHVTQTSLGAVSVAYSGQALTNGLLPFSLTSASKPLGLRSLTKQMPAQL